MNIDITTLDAFLDRKRRTLHLPGLAVAVVQEGRIGYLYGRGVTPHTPLIIGSVSKSFTALAALQLVEAGKLALDAPVQQYIPWFRLDDAAASATITIKHLLTHTSGISRYAGRTLLAGRGGKTIEQSVRDLRRLRLSKPVGVGFQYSNINYLIVGLVVEVVSGQPFGAYIQQHILSPLNMQHSYVSEHTARGGGLASGYRWWFGVPLPFRAPYLDDALPAAFMAASVEDMARYALALLGGGSLDGATVLLPAGVAEMHRPQVATAASSSYGLGWRVEKLGDVPIVRHGGEVSNFLSEMILLPEQRAGIILLINVSNGLAALAVKDVTRLGSDVARYLLGMSQPRRLSFRRFYTLLNAALVALSAYQIWSLAAVLRSGSPRLRSVLGLAALCEVGLAALAAWRIPRWADSPWSLLRLYVPDVVSWLAAFFCGSLIKCFVTLILRSHSRPGAGLVARGSRSHWRR